MSADGSAPGLPAPPPAAPPPAGTPVSPLGTPPRTPSLRQTVLGDKLARQIAQGGPIPVSLFMAFANGHYYATRDPLGLGGDFITAPEISQLFGELIGLWAADAWLRAGRPDGLIWAELGPGRGTLTADALRAMRRFGCAPAVHFVETSPVLRDAQAARVPGALFHDDVASLPDSGPLLIIANEFFDALPIRQLVLSNAGWRERMVTGEADGVFATALGGTPMNGAVPRALQRQDAGAVLETCPAGAAIIEAAAQRLAAQGGAMLVIDYGYEETGIGETLQAMTKHGYADPFANAGEQDITAHVDFSALAAAARRGGAVVAGPVGQGDFLGRLGIAERVAALAAANPAQAATLAAAHARLTAPDQMGTMFKALALHAPGWPLPEGFAS